MKDCEMLPRSLIAENRVGWPLGILLIAALFMVMFLPWLTAERELFRQEGFFAAVAVELAESGRAWQDGIPATAHHVVMDDTYPLYPLVVSMIYRLGVPMETALRVVSVTMLGILSLLAGIAAASRSNGRAGLVAACCCFGTLFAFDKAPVGGAETMAGCFLFAAQLLFFHYGSRLADWNSAWIAAAILLSFGFLAAGPVVILFFAVPLLFLRRPLSSSGKFRTAGFVAGTALLTVVAASWILPQEFLLRQYGADTVVEPEKLREYFYGILDFPLTLAIRFLPWSVVMWMPFCVALQAVSPLPVYSLYLRTLTISMFFLVWLLPGTSAARLFLMIGPLAVLTGIYYDLGVRRYGVVLRRIITVGSLLFPVTGGYLLILRFMPDWILAYWMEPEKIVYRTSDRYTWGMLVVLGFLAVLAMAFYVCINRFPIWINLLLLCFGISGIGIGVLLPHRLTAREWRRFGEDVIRVLPPEANRIYKYEILGMFNGLFYTGKPIYKLRHHDRLPDGPEKVYLISPRPPDLPSHSWRPLLPEGYTCRGTEVSLWEGVPVLREFGSDE